MLQHLYKGNVVLMTLHCHFAGATPFNRAHFGRGTGRILLDNLLCNSRETRLIDCPHNGIGVHNCVHSEDAGIRCQRKFLLYVAINPSMLLTKKLR